MAKMFVFLESRVVVFYGAEITVARELEGLSQEGMAMRLIAVGIDQIGGSAMSQQTISRLEGKGVGFMTRAEALAFCEVLGIEGD